jgi:flagellar FliL protein
MSEDKKDAVADAPKKSSKKMMIIAIAAVVVLGGGGGAFFMLKGGSKAEAAPKKGTVVAIDNPITINLTDGHYLKLGFSLQQTDTMGADSVDTSEALNLAIDEYTGLSVAQITTEKQRDALKDDLLAKIVKAYTVDKKEEVMGIYFTSFVTQ